MKTMKLSFCLLLIIMMATMMMTFAEAGRRGDKIYFQDSFEYDVDEHPGAHGRRNRNHRGRGVGNYQKHNNNLPQFEEGIPGVYPIRGSPQAPLVLPSPPPAGGVDLHNHNTQQLAPIPAETTLPYEITKNSNSLPNQQHLNHPYANNLFLANIPVGSVAPTINKFNPSVSPGVSNQLPSLDKPATTTTNPRRVNLLYGSNLLEEDNNRDGKTEQQTEISFDDRGLFDTAPLCQPGHILVNNKCRLAV